MLFFLVNILSALLAPRFTFNLATALFKLIFFVPVAYMNYSLCSWSCATVYIPGKRCIVQFECRNMEGTQVCSAPYYPELQLLCRRAAQLLNACIVIQGSWDAAGGTGRFWVEAELELSAPGRWYFQVLFPFIESGMFLLQPYSWNEFYLQGINKLPITAVARRCIYKLFDCESWWATCYSSAMNVTL